MSKFIKRIGSVKEKFYVFMKIISVEIPVKERYTNVVIEWKRGNKKSVTGGDKFISPDYKEAIFDETFTKHSVFYKDQKNNIFFRKLANFRVKGVNENGKEKIIGEIDLDIS
jgi:hypothetical protein